MYQISYSFLYILTWFSLSERLISRFRYSYHQITYFQLITIKMVNVITYSFISIFCLLINNFSFVLSIIALQSNSLKQKNLQSVTTNSKYNNSIENEVESESANTIARGYKDCTEALINKTRKRNILIEYKYYEGYYLYPR